MVFETECFMHYFCIGKLSVSHSFVDCTSLFTLFTGGNSSQDIFDKEAPSKDPLCEAMERDKSLHQEGHSFQGKVHILMQAIYIISCLY